MGALEEGKMKTELKELLFAQLQALSRAYQTSVSMMSAYEREVDRLDKELAEERAARARADAELVEERARADAELVEERAARARADAELVEERAARARADAELADERAARARADAALEEDEEDDDPLSVV
jgi:hypothetical protein